MSDPMKPGTLALCIPAFNAAQFLPRLLGSAAAQKIPFDELLVYDDCSTDDTAEVARALGATVVQ
jgi:glycosyltransferase involved in cell wall biosynthesis